MPAGLIGLVPSSLEPPGKISPRVLCLQVDREVLGLQELVDAGVLGKHVGDQPVLGVGEFNSLIEKRTPAVLEHS